MTNNNNFITMSCHAETRFATLRSSMERTKRSRKSLLSSVHNNNNNNKGECSFTDLIIKQDIYDNDISRSIHGLAQSVIGQQNCSSPFNAAA